MLTIPVVVGKRESLARYIDPKNIKKELDSKKKPTGRELVKWQAFSATRWPFSVSVDRANYADGIDERALREGRRIAWLIAEDVSAVTCHPKVVSARTFDLPAHAEIRLRLASNPSIKPKSKNELSAEEWSEAVEMFEALAAIAMANRPPR